MDIVHELETLNSLKEKGIITEEDFQTQKTRLLQENLKPKDEGASMKEAYVSYWKHSFKWRGRATRSEFWWPILVNFLISIGLTIVGAFMPVLSLIQILFGIACIFPTLAVWVRRYHDLGHSAWFAFIPQFLALVLVPIIILTVGRVITEIETTPPLEKHEIVITLISGVILSIAGIVWGYVFPCLPGQKEANKYGLPKA